VSEFGFRALTGEDWKFLDEKALIGKGGPLRLKEGEDDGAHTFASLDSGIPGCRWHRAVLDAEIPENSTITIAFRTAEAAGTGDGPVWSEAVTVLFKDARDCLIQAPAGRYIEIKARLQRMNKDTPTPLLRALKAYYPRRSYLRYLPAAYQKDEASCDFLERFLSVFESELYDSEEMISRIPSYFDPLAAPNKFVPWLASWLSLDLYELLGEKNREFVLRAVEFYKKKGTASGLTELVTFLTGRRCCVKEYVNNIFRSYGMEHGEEDETIERDGCERSRRKPSRTVDTRDLDLVAKMDTYFDEVHYTSDPSEKSRHSRNSIGLFIFLLPGEELVINKVELRKIIESFLPVFVRVHITTVESLGESFNLADVTDVYGDHLSIFLGEKLGRVEGVYRDSASWSWLHACRMEEKSNDRCHRTPHGGLDVDIAF
jgi:phage tail-like protein